MGRNSSLPKSSTDICKKLGHLAVKSSQVKSSQVKSSHVTSRPVTSRPVPSRRVASRRVTSRHVKSRHVTSSQVKSSQVKSAPTPVGEPNVRAEAEKENIDTPETVQPTGVSQKTWY